MPARSLKPVLPRLHNCRKGRRQPRPLSHGEVELCRHLRERGDACLRLAFAIGLESGLRAGEICRLEINDIDPVQQRIRVGLPTKTIRERTAFFGEKTRECLAAWMKERSHDCGHRKLLHRSSGRPFTAASLHDAFARVLCKTFQVSSFMALVWSDGIRIACDTRWQPIW
jgi:integrase/recombinase XerC